MNAAETLEETKPARVRTPRKTNDQTTKQDPAKLAKSQDPTKVKVTLYLDIEVANKLVVSTVTRRGSDQSDIANEILKRGLSSVTYYDRPTRPVRPTDTSLPVSEFGNEAAA
jgi:hypothetical protein